MNEAFRWKQFFGVFAGVLKYLHKQGWVILLFPLPPRSQSWFFIFGGSCLREGPRGKFDKVLAIGGIGGYTKRFV
jgi:hypothetical protein